MLYGIYTINTSVNESKELQQLLPGARVSHENGGNKFFSLLFQANLNSSSSP